MHCACPKRGEGGRERRVSGRQRAAMWYRDGCGCGCGCLCVDVDVGEWIICGARIGETEAEVVVSARRGEIGSG